MRSLGLSTTRTRTAHTPAVTLALGLTAALVLNGGALAVLSFAYIGLLAKAPPAMVQLESGRSITTEPLDSTDRTPAVIQTFVRDTFTLLFSASGQLPPQGGNPPVADTGVNVQTDRGSLKISTVASLAAWGLSDEDNFRAEFLKKLAQYTPQDAFGNGSTEMALSIRYISEPIVGTEPGTWRVTVMGEQIVRSAQSPTGAAIPFNRVISLRAITPPEAKDYSTLLERQIATVRQSGLVIEKIEPYQQ